MNQELNRQDWDALSAYLDNELKPRERQRLEKQYQSRPEMRSALHELRQTRYLLRRTPSLRPPRNFTLTPEMAGVRSPRARSYPIFRLAFALASILFVMVIVGEFTLGNPAASSVAMAPAAESMVVEETMAEAETMMEESAMTAQDVAETAPEGERMAETPVGGGGGEDVPPSENYQVAEEPSPTEEPSLKGPPVTEEVESFAVEAVEPGTVDPETGITSDAPLPEPGFMGSPWRLLQIIFGAAFILSGLGLVLLRRKK
jgi:hypothetical protein